MTITWRHINQPANADGVAWVETQNYNVLQFGGFAEVERTGHSSCTPSTYEGHQSGLCPIAGTFVETSGGNVHTSIGFTAPPGTSVRCHVWDLT